MSAQLARCRVPAAGKAARMGWAVAFAVAFVFACLLPRIVGAQAGPPYQTDDPDPVPYHHWEMYLATQDAIAGNAVSGTAQLEANYGARPWLQLHAVVPLAYAHPESGSPTFWGMGDVELGAKARFVTEGRWRPMIGTFIMTELPVGSAAHGLATPSVHVLAPLWFQKTFGAWSTDAGGGYLFDFDKVNGNYWATGWLLQRQLSERATVGTELYHTTQHGDTPASLLSNVGLVFNLTEHEQLLVSVGRNVSGPRTLQTYIGYYVTGGH